MAGSLSIEPAGVQNFGGSDGREGLPGNRYKHIPVRFSPAIHGLRNFRKAPPAHHR